MQMLETANYEHAQLIIGRMVVQVFDGNVQTVFMCACVGASADGEQARVPDEALPTDIEDDTKFEIDLERRTTEGSMTCVVLSRSAFSLASHQYPGLGAAVDSRTNATRVGGGGGGLRSQSAPHAAQPSRIPTPSSSRQLPTRGRRPPLKRLPRPSQSPSHQ